MDQQVETGAQSVARAVAIWRRVGRAARDGLGLADLARQTGLAKPTARRILIALMREGLVEQDPVSRRYYPGEETFVFGMLAGDRFGLGRIARPSVIRLARMTGDTAFLTVPRGLHALCLIREEGSHPVRTHALQAGDEHPLGIGAGSLAILAGMEDADILIPQIAALLGAPPYAAYDPVLLRDAVAAARASGFALNPGLIVPSSWGIGMAIRHPLGHVAGALSIAAIDQRMTAERQPELAALMRDEVSRIETDLQNLFRRER